MIALVVTEERVEEVGPGPLVVVCVIMDTKRFMDLDPS